MHLLSVLSFEFVALSTIVVYYRFISNRFNLSFTGSIHREYRCSGVFYPRIVMNVHLPMPDGSCPFCRTAEEMLLKANIDVPPGLESEFHLIFDSEVQKLILFFGQVSFTVCLNL